MEGCRSFTEAEHQENFKFGRQRISVLSLWSFSCQISRGKCCTAAHLSTRCLEALSAVFSIFRSYWPGFRRPLLSCPQTTKQLSRPHPRSFPTGAHAPDVRVALPPQRRMLRGLDSQAPGLLSAQSDASLLVAGGVWGSVLLWAGCFSPPKTPFSSHLVPQTSTSPAGSPPAPSQGLCRSPRAEQRR